MSVRSLRARWSYRHGLESLPNDWRYSFTYPSKTRGETDFGLMVMPVNVANIVMLTVNHFASREAALWSAGILLAIVHPLLFAFIVFRNRCIPRRFRFRHRGEPLFDLTYNPRGAAWILSPYTGHWDGEDWLSPAKNQVPRITRKGDYPASEVAAAFEFDETVDGLTSELAAEELRRLAVRRTEKITEKSAGR